LSEYVVLKLCTGEQLLAEVANETLDGISVFNPIQVKTIPIMQEGEYGEQVISNRYCTFSNDIQFTFNYKDIIYCKDLNPVIVKYYKKLVLAFGEENSKRDAFYTQVSDEEIEKVQQELTNTHIKIH
jgi:hypothetical protein